ncbi:MAG: hypothetical protein EPO40_17700 [Myxococcaceae bacterium]|nr:MAG: hypothetical protein EPO40_17700 [Myxococcaceae bacterium]
MLILDRTATLHEVALAWWWGRRALLDAGLPEVNAKDGGPTVDPCALDGRLFYLLAVPTPMVPGTEDWGGVQPKGDVGEAGDIPLHIAAVQQAGLRARDVDEPAHFTRWPSATVPENRRAAVRHGLRVITSSKRAGGYRGRVERVDFTAVMVDDTGLNLLEWALRELEPGQEVAIGFPFDARAPGDGILQGSSCRLHRSDDGRVWLHSFKHTASYFHQPASGVVEENLPGVEMISSSAPRPQSAAAKRADLVNTILGPSRPVMEIAAEAAQEYSEERAEGAERERQQARRAVRYATLEERIAAKKAAADALDPTLVVYARRATKLAKEWAPLLRRHLEAQGLYRADEPCGWNQGLGDVLTHRMSVKRRWCDRFSCYRCGPVLLGQKGAGICVMPVVDSAGKVVGPSLEDRLEVYRYEIPTKKLRLWRDRFQETVDSNPAFGSVSQSSTDPKAGFDPDAPAYVAFINEETTVVLATLALPPSRKGGGGAPVATLPGHAVRETVLELMKATYTAVPSYVDGIHGSGPFVVDAKVTGKVTSSRGLRLNPDELVRVASPHAYVERLRVAPSVKKSAEILRSRTVGIQELEAAGESPSLSTYPVPDPDEQDAHWEALAAAVEPEAGVPGGDVVVSLTRAVCTPAADLDAMQVLLETSTEPTPTITSPAVRSAVAA